MLYRLAKTNTLFIFILVLFVLFVWSIFESVFSYFLKWTLSLRDFRLEANKQDSLSFYFIGLSLTSYKDAIHCNFFYLLRITQCWIMFVRILVEIHRIVYNSKQVVVDIYEIHTHTLILNLCALFTISFYLSCINSKINFILKTIHTNY